MARKTTPLTDKEIKAVKPKEKTYRLFDGGGLHLEISPKGQKWWRLKYRFDGKEKRISLGVYPHTSLQEARKQRELLKEQIAKGVDPAKTRKEEKADLQAKEAKDKHTFEYLTDAYFTHIAGLENPLSENYREKQKKRVEKHCYPTLKNKPINDITEEDLEEIFEALKQKGYHEVGRRIFLLLRAILKYGVKRRLLKYSVAEGFSAKDEFGERSHKHFPIITDKKELKALLTALDSYGGDFSTKQALRVMPYLAFRPANIRFLEWDEVDIDEGIITILGSKMKMSRDFISPIPPTVMKILEETRLYSGDGKYVFPSPIHRDRPLSENTLNVALRRLGYTREQLVSHSFRRIFSTLAHENMKEHKVSSLAIELQLAHKDKNQIREIYNESDLIDNRMDLMKWWDGYLTGLREGK